MNDTTTLKKSLLMIQKLKKRLQEHNEKIFDPVAIIGMSCRIPDADNPKEFWELLCKGKNIISSMPEERWELLKGTREPGQRDTRLPYWGGYLSEIAAFDAYFFGISPREAMRMDPQQRLLLEVAYESIEDAGLTVEALAGSQMGVFASLYASQFSHLQTLDSEMDALFIPTGSAISIAANRLSYLFDLRGPSLVLDTACSSSLIAIQLACLNLQAQLCDTALVSAVNLNLLPSIHSVLAKATMLSPTGQCHTFDAKADGYVQGEGAGSIILKPLSKALKDHDKIYAVIMGGAINQDGKTNGLTAPNGLQQEQLLRSAYRTAKINPALVSYIECHGTGTFLGDPIEIQALGEVIGKNRDADKPCWISSVKTNIGHLEPAAGIMSVIKVALALKNGCLPPHLNFSQANPHLALERYSLRIPQQVEQLPRYGDRCIAGVSGFGFGGANAHLILREISSNEQFPAAANNPPQDKELFTISAKDTSALSALIGRWSDFLKNNPDTNLAQLCYNLHTRRSHYLHRLAIITDSVADLYQKLETLKTNPQAKNEGIFLNQEIPKTGKPPQVSEEEMGDLLLLAQKYVHHATIDWKRVEANRIYKHMDMPFYPWQHKAYWPTFGHETQEAASIGYPMRGKLLSSPLATQQFEFRFDTKTLPEVQDTFNVLHAGFYLEMLAYATKQLHPSSAFRVLELNFLSPILVLEGNSVLTHLIIEKKAQNSLAFRFFSNDGNGKWIEHATGILGLSTYLCSRIDAQNTLRGRLPVSGTMETFYKRITAMGMPAGDTIRWANHYWTNSNELFCELRAPKASERGKQFVTQMHPGIIDACIQTFFLLLPEHFSKPYIASHIDTLEFYGSAEEQRYIYAVLKELHPEGKHIIGDWYLLDKNYNLIAQCHGLRLTLLNDTLQINQIMAIQSQFQLDLSLPYETCKNKLIHYLSEQLGMIFSMPQDDINPFKSLHDLGMDSLMALAVIRIIETNLHVTYSLPLMMQGPSINEIAEYVLSSQWVGPKPNPPASKSPLETVWIANRKIQDNAQVRLFCFPYGGGGASIYREWQQEFPDFIEVCPVQLPGRENRMEEQPLEQLDALVSLLAYQLKPQFDLPFAFFGHSFGSLIGFELSRFLRRHHLPTPAHLFVSAYPDPRVPSKSLHNLLAKLQQMKINLFDLNSERLGDLNDEQLTALSLVFQENGIVDYSDERMNKSIIKVLLPIFIGDMNIVKSYTYHDELPLAQNATVFLGKYDAWVSPEDHWGWADHFSKSCEFQQFDGGHLFVREKETRTQIIKKITENLLHLSSAEIEECVGG
ncbi:beta-ketoacyl synthase N-terminal-like domain-containing protein [Fluoribacter dumoffii]|uniref:beta-ketoacyl synthase N-terminal-like domain-containing protein n=1 Tax=Fluoribacter dumoffii TaxID=463 RepID=UPI0022437FB5|nr:beta-ketoacyl synthase N-terminal-like domain-containing protein [Fluoribacter dumoffii]MCW8417491.1 beta-ketoacyl synthase N-terminal-like domain-containing protein [Fluoribacter dumoffii]MCW8454667.1 beta-ketoacyl synthase N-terminal-like domain-containing protein [Fluoribacter dumoffii]MCW8461255.1 beta-ketoacyl synthase N-terminal-like domain-containing protein [Fluoribacter dumoffii]MCW8484696.1 beta-ketoacyl synthase N-terminal-like domain-containing protein [Fluoribacter dumoffii]